MVPLCPEKSWWWWVKATCTRRQKHLIKFKHLTGSMIQIDAEQRREDEVDQ
jgi:hypothetical protein